MHVLEAVVPGHDLGDSPSIEAELGGVTLECPIPSTLQSDNIVFALPPVKDGVAPEDNDPVVHIRAYDSNRRSAGLVVVPLNTLVPLEVWNVWYAMDEEDEEDDEAWEKPPEDTPKMHLLLQYVSAETAAEESEQVREVRTQDFLLRALQQLNAALEAKVMHGQNSELSMGDPRDGASQLGATASTASLLPADQSAALSPPPSPPRPAPRRHDNSNSTSQLASLEEPSEATTAAQRAQKAQLDEAVQRRVEPYKQVIDALQEKQRFFDDQELQVQQLSSALQVQEQKTHELYTKLYETARRYAAEVEGEREKTRVAETAKGVLEQRISDLEGEVSLRKAHEDSLQKRVTLMESELSVVHQKCVIIDSVEEQASNMRKEASVHEAARVQIQEQLEEQSTVAARLYEETWQLKEEKRLEVAKMQSEIDEQKQAVEVLNATLQDYQDMIRDKDVEAKLAAERIAELSRQVTNAEAEATSYRAMLDSEKEQRKDSERRFDQQELQRLQSGLDAHKETIRQLREEAQATKQAARDDQVSRDDLEAQLAATRAELEKEKRVGAERDQRLANQEELREQAREMRAQNDELKSRMEKIQADARKITEHYEQEIAEHSRSGRQLAQERDAKQRELVDLQGELSENRLEVRELQTLQEQLVQSLDATRSIAEQAEDYQRALQQSQDDIREARAARENEQREIALVTAKFQERTLQVDSRTAELEALLDNRNNEIKLLMYRVQELSSKYTPVKGDKIDEILAKWVNGYRPAVPFFRLGNGQYLFGRRQVLCKISNDKPVFRVGGGFVGFDKFLELHASDELERLLNYDVDERTGDPKFVEALRLRDTVENSTMLEELRQNAIRGGPGLARSTERVSAPDSGARSRRQ